MPPQREPDEASRLIAHLLVGATAAYAFRRAGAAGGIVGAFIGILVHEAFDAPLTQVLSELGA
jgi:hypothetical protein